MKIGIIGAGAVGAACAMATIMRGCASELVLVNRGRDRAKGMATDMGYGPAIIHHRGDGW
jgi:L-lactate dehydrogenase